MDDIQKQRNLRIMAAYWRLRISLCKQVPNGDKLWSHAKLAQYSANRGGSQYLADVMAKDFDEAYNEAVSV